MRQMHSSLVSTWVCGAFYAVYVLRHAERRTRSAIRFFSLTVLFALLAIGNIAGNAASSTLPAGLV